MYLIVSIVGISAELYGVGCVARWQPPQMPCNSRITAPWDSQPLVSLCLGKGAGLRAFNHFLGAGQYPGPGFLPL